MSMSDNKASPFAVLTTGPNTPLTSIVERAMVDCVKPPSPFYVNARTGEPWEDDEIHASLMQQDASLQAMADRIGVLKDLLRTPLTAGRTFMDQLPATNEVRIKTPMLGKRIDSTPCPVISMDGLTLAKVRAIVAAAAGLLTDADDTPVEADSPTLRNILRMQRELEDLRTPKQAVAVQAAGPGKALSTDYFLACRQDGRHPLA